MSYFRATCERCGETYTHLFVGRTLYSGHVCPLKSSPTGEVVEGNGSNPAPPTNAAGSGETVPASPPDPARSSAALKEEGAK